jgi:hypothetical protein
MAMQEKHTKNVEASTYRASEKFYLENTLLRVSGALFATMQNAQVSASRRSN